jgi:hypothetical protein
MSQEKQVKQEKPKVDLKSLEASKKIKQKALSTNQMVTK